ncbi:C-type lectin 1-like [Teleopsis dalmanni]|uniref:C-type lectin 1-like n=1 Tax=Teleopsis dalmanni TaxID=139649 RepID=UPI0018CD2B79|nr:C-type lectin 1-like [Teleopsis dalmanni]
MKFLTYFLALVVLLSVVTAQTNINYSGSGSSQLTNSNTTTYLNQQSSNSNSNGNQNNSTGLQNLFNNVGNWSGGFSGNLGYFISPRTAVSYSIGAFSKVNWFTAQRICKYNGLTLATITSAAEAKAIRNLIRDNEVVSPSELFWIGATKYPDKGDYWSWFGSGNPATYTNWATGQPNSRSDYCLQVGSSGWDDKNCNIQAYFICQSVSC